MYDACEQAYKHGYDDGRKEILNKISEYIHVNFKDCFAYNKDVDTYSKTIEDFCDWLVNNGYINTY